VRFGIHSPQLVSTIKIDWDAPVDRTPTVREAMAPNDVDQMHAGVLLRGFAVDGVTYPRGTIAFRVAQGHELFLQLPFEEAPRVVPRVKTPTVYAVDGVAGQERHRVTVGDDVAGERVDVILASAIPTLSRAVVQRCIHDGHVSLGGQPVEKANLRLKTGDVVELVAPRPSEPAA